MRGLPLSERVFVIPIKPCSRYFLSNLSTERIETPSFFAAASLR